MKASEYFMEYQSREKHYFGAFEFFGIDIIADEAGDCWLIEANRLPGLESSKNNLEEEDIMYNEMMSEQLQIILKPLIASKLSLPITEIDRLMTKNEGGWHQVKEASTIHSENEVNEKHGAFVNLFRWKAFVKELSKDILIK